ncbi:MAG TPA: VOC family protein [Burkholderiales bacterium]|nr:VOC family protein [Burkholderiales bacterium]
MKLKTLFATLALCAPMGALAAGLPGLRGSDHLGITVPKLDQAVDFFVNVIGCEAFYKMGPFKADDDWMQVHLDVNPRAEIPSMRLVRCGYGVNLEIFEYSVPEQSKAPPKNSDIGGHHLAFYVDDMAKAVAHLKANGVKVLGEPTVMGGGPTAGETWVYFMAPWGMQLELVSYPKGKAYEKEYKSRLWSATNPAK